MMKKTAVFLLLLAVFYISGMYDSPALMVLFLTQAFFLTVMFFLTFRFKKNLTISFFEKLVFAQSGQPLTWKLKAVNRGRLPVSRFSVQLRLTSGKKRGIRRTVFGSSGCGEQTLSYGYLPEHCGKLVFHAERLRVFDYLSFFSRRMKLQDQMEVLIFPPRYVMQIGTGILRTGGENLYSFNSAFSGNDYGEIRQIREYRPGDSVRHIHWNQTARTEGLWVKEYEEESKGQICLLLSLRGRENPSPEDMDAFYTLTYALLSGLLAQRFSVRVFFPSDGKVPLSEMTVRDDNGCRELLSLLYSVSDEAVRSSMKNVGITDNAFQGSMMLDLNLGWSVDGRMIYRFSRDRLKEELTQVYENWGEGI